MRAFYRDLELMRNEKYDGNDYHRSSRRASELWKWDIADGIRNLRLGTDACYFHLYICWAAQAGLYHHYGIPKYRLEKKMFGIFEHHVRKGFQQLPISADLMMYFSFRTAGIRK